MLRIIASQYLAVLILGFCNRCAAAAAAQPLVPGMKLSVS